ncbi:MAG: S24 family peptidase [Candidatus Dojkabacteria bacterium]|jgi:repressor LexA|nr:S24 family peptidase [Candidatus Dojkabacteria bacterium]
MLTEKQSSVFRFVKEYIKRYGKGPSLAQISREVQINNRNNVIRLIDVLEKKGLLNRDEISKELKLIDKTSFVYVPILGYANAGVPVAIAESQNIGYLAIDKKIIQASEDLFSVIIQGDSMDQCSVNGKYLEDGKYAIVKSNRYDLGKPVLVIVDGCATIKILDKDPAGEYIILRPQSSNTSNRPIYVYDENDLVINGEIIDVLSN